MDIVERVEFEKYAKSKTPAQFAMTTKAEVFSAGYRTALEAAGVRELVEALEDCRLALHDWLHIYADDLCDEDEVMKSKERVYAIGTLAYIATCDEKARAALSRYRGEL